jgi:hypothetical protein
MKTTVNTSNFRSTVFSRAWAIKRNTNEIFKICLVRAWEIYRLVKRMRHEIVRFAYKKLDNTLRYAQGTLENMQMFVKGSKRARNYSVVTYYDIDSLGFRCFKAQNLIRIY